MSFNRLFSNRFRHHLTQQSLIGLVGCLLSTIAYAEHSTETLRFSIHEHHRSYFEDSLHAGIFKRIINQVSADSGITFVPIWRSGDSTGKDELLTGQVDFIIDAPKQVADEFNPNWVTPPIIHGHAATLRTIASSMQIQDPLSSQKVGYLGGIANLQNPIISGNWIRGNSPNELVEFLLREDIQMAVLPLRIANHLLNSGLHSQLLISEINLDNPFTYSWIFHPSRISDKNRIELLIAQWPEPILNQVLQPSFKSVSNTFSQAFNQWLIPSGALFACVLIAMTSWIWQLRRDRYRILQRETKLAASKSKAIAASTAKTNFLATISHEIRTPMHAVLGVHELLLHKKSLHPEDHRLLHNAQTSAKSLLEILNQVLDVSKIEAGKFQLKFHAVSIRETLQSLIAPFEALALNKSIDCEFVIDENISNSLLVDELRLRQVLQNLLSNSVKFTNKGSIRLSCRVLSDTHATQLLEFCVADTGIGMHRSDIVRLLEPYEQAIHSNTQPNLGTGLGLSIAQGIVNSMGSQLIVDSDFGYGTSISFSLKLHRSSAKPRQTIIQSESKVSEPAKISFAPRMCLIVDDHPANLSVMEIQLQQLGFKTLTASNGTAALNLIQSLSIDLVITDESMPHMSGRELASNIRQFNEGIVIVGLTADIFAHQDKDTYLASGMNALLVKPIDLDQLRNCLMLCFPTYATWDIEHLSQYTNGCQSSCKQIIQAILDLQESALEYLNNPSHNAAELKRLIHKIRGGASLIKARSIVLQCSSIEDGATDSQISETAIAKLSNELRINNQDLRHFLTT